MFTFLLALAVVVLLEDLTATLDGVGPGFLS